MKRFLSAKHWHLFLLIYGVQLLSRFFFGLNYDPNEDLQDQVLLSALGVLVGVLVFFLWIWSINVLLAKELNLSGIPSLYLFKLCISLVVVSLAVTFVAAFFLRDVLGFLFTVVPFVTLILIIYCLAFTARTLKSIELARIATLNDYVGDILLFFILPIGIWFIQPRVNKIFAGVNH